MDYARRLNSGEDPGGPPGVQWTNRPAIVFPWINIVFWGMGVPLGLTAWLSWAWAAWQTFITPYTRNRHGKVSDWLQGVAQSRHLVIWVWVWRVLRMDGIIVGQIDPLSTADLSVHDTAGGGRFDRPRRLGCAPRLAPEVVARGFDRGAGGGVSRHLWLGLGVHGHLSPDHHARRGFALDLRECPHGCNVEPHRERRSESSAAAVLQQRHTPGVIINRPPHFSRSSPDTTLQSATINRLIDLNGDPEPETLRLTISASPDGTRPIASADLTAHVEQAGARGGSFTFNFAPTTLPPGRLLCAADFGQRRAGAGREQHAGERALGRSSSTARRWPRRLQHLSRYRSAATTIKIRRKSWNELVSWLDTTDYMMLTSNRAYASMSRMPHHYPMTSEFYRPCSAANWVSS